MGQRFRALTGNLHQLLKGITNGQRLFGHLFRRQTLLHEHVTGELVRLADQKGCALADLSLADMRAVEDGITDAVFDVLTVENSVGSRTSYGGTAPENVRAQVGRARERFL